MIRYVTFRKKPKDLLALTGLARREFDELLPRFEQALPKPPKRRKRRQRAPGVGRTPALPTAADKLLFIRWSKCRTLYVNANVPNVCSRRIIPNGNSTTR